MKKYTIKEAIENKKDFILDMIESLQAQPNVYQDVDNKETERTCFSLCYTIAFLIPQVHEEASPNRLYSDSEMDFVLRKLGLGRHVVAKLTPHLFSTYEPFWFEDKYNSMARIEFLKEFIKTL